MLEAILSDCISGNYLKITAQYIPLTVAERLPLFCKQHQFILRIAEFFSLVSNPNKQYVCQI